MTIVFIIFFFCIPAAILYMERRVKWVAWIGAVILCYLVGIFLGNLPFAKGVDLGIIESVAGVSALLAIALELFSTDMAAWLKTAGRAMLSFGLGIVAAVIAALTAFFLVGKNIELLPAADLAGMATGVYTGGTANLTAIGIARGVNGETIGLINLADALIAIPYLIFLFTAMKVSIRWFLPKSEHDNFEENTYSQNIKSLDISHKIKYISISILLATACLGVSFGLGMLFPVEGGEPNISLVIMATTAMAMLLSRIKNIRKMPLSFETGEYLLLVFSIAIGSMMRVEQFQQHISDITIFLAIAAYGAFAIHLLLARLFKIDADTLIVTSVAAIMSPVFIPIVARILNNRKIIPAGMTSGVIGFAVGTFLGILIATLLS